MNRPPHRPPTLNDDECSLSDLTEYLYKTPYGDEDERVLRRLAARHDELSWHALFRVWLQCTDVTINDNNTLPLVLSKLQASLLHDYSSLLWDTTEDTTWKQDAMVQEWNVARYFVKKDVEKWAPLKRHEHVDVQRIVSGIDKLVGYVEKHETRTPAQVMDEYYEKKSQQSKNKPENCQWRSSEEFTSWIASHVHESTLDIERLLQAVERGPQWRVRRAVLEIPSHEILRNLCRNSGDYRRGRALLGSFLLYNSNGNSLDQIVMAPVPSLSSTDNIKTVVRDYLLKDNDMLPNVHQLALDLWGNHLHREDITEAIRDFASWLPIEPVAARYQSLWKDNGANATEMMRATDFLCILIGNEAKEEWKEIWNDDFMKNTWMPLIHALVLGPSEDVKRYAMVVAVVESILQHISPDSLVATCPQLGWITFLLSDIPTEEKGSIQRDQVKGMKRLYERLNARNEETLLPPMTLYIESVMSACALSHSEETTDTWVGHVVQTLALYKKKDEVAVEWFRCLSKQETLNSLAQILHRQVCHFLWESNEANSSICLPQLLIESKQSRILLCTPPEYLFASTSVGLVSSLQQLLSAFGETGDNLGVIAVGLALVIQDDVSSAMKCRDVLYQNLRPMVKEGHSHSVESIERALSQHPASLEWWKTLYAELVRNEVPLFAVNEERSTFDISLIDEFLSRKRKRPREEDAYDLPANPAEETMQSAKSKARYRESATTIIRNLYGDTKQPKEEPESTRIGNSASNEAEFTVPENDAEILNDEDNSDDYNDEDEQILLL